MQTASQILQEKLLERQSHRPGYSLRAFARDLGLSPSQLSLVMNNKRGLSAPVTAQVVARLELDSRQAQSFECSMRAKFSSSSVTRKIAAAQLEHLRTQGQTRNLELDLFQSITNWHHFGLVELIKIGGRRRDARAWFSKRLEIPENEVALALGRLERLELIRRVGAGYEVNQESVLSDHPQPNEAIKKFHRQILERALAALAFQTSDERYGISNVMPTRVKNLPRAKKLIQKFRNEFAQEISDHEGGDEIYGLSLQFFRLTKAEGKNENEDK
jgi:uncharacterized protein (TIGR02147 family)